MSIADNIDIEINNCPADSNGVARKNAVVIDRKGNRAWSGEGATENEATTKAVRNFIGDRRSREYIGNG